MHTVHTLNCKVQGELPASEKILTENMEQWVYRQLLMYLEVTWFKSEYLLSIFSGNKLILRLLEKKCQTSLSELK